MDMVKVKDIIMAFMPSDKRKEITKCLNIILKVYYTFVNWHLHLVDTPCRILPKRSSWRKEQKSWRSTQMVACNCLSIWFASSSTHLGLGGPRYPGGPMNIMAWDLNMMWLDAMGRGNKDDMAHICQMAVSSFYCGVSNIIHSITLPTSFFQLQTPREDFW